MTGRRRTALCAGWLGCLCYGAGDWLMIYGDPARVGALSWLTAGTAAMPQWRLNAAMALAFPGILFYGAALFALQGYIPGEREQRTYRCLNAFGLTPWIALHLFYVMILTLFSWMNANGFAAQAASVCEGLYGRLRWLVPACEAMMLPVFVYWFWLQIRGKTALPRAMAFVNVLTVLALFKGVTMLMPESAFRLAFTNGLMSESMAIWFGTMWIWERRQMQ